MKHLHLYFTNYVRSSYLGPLVFLLAKT